VNSGLCGKNSLSLIEVKIDGWGDYLYFVLNYMHLVKATKPWATEIDELDIFLGRNYIVTHHDNPIH
jgi:magnesium transporter